MNVSPPKAKTKTRSRNRWVQHVLTRVLQRLGPILTGQLALLDCRVNRQGEFWSFRLTVCVREPSQGCRSFPGEKLQVTGLGSTRLRSHWLPGDPRISECLQAAVAGAVAEIANKTGAGLRVCRWPESICSSRLNSD